MAGISLDMRCRDYLKNHEECPEYIRQNEGRAADGSEGFGAHSIAGSGRGQPTGTRQVGAAADPFTSRDYTTHTNGGPSTGVLDDADFGRTFRHNPIVVGRPQSDLKKLMENAKPFEAAPPEIDTVRDLNPDEPSPPVKDPWSLTGD